MSFSIAASLSIVCFLYILIGITGFLSFKELTRENVLNNFLPDNTMANISKFAFTIQLIISLTVLHYVCRESLESLLFKNWNFSWFRWISIQVLLLGAMYGISASFKKITVIFSLTGAIGGVLIFYVLF
jgi:amino acid permease